MSEFEPQRDIDSVANNRAKRQLREVFETRILRENEGRETSYPEDTIARIEANIEDFKSDCTRLAIRDFEALMAGKSGSLDIDHEEDSRLQGQIDLEALQLLYYMMLYVGEEPEDARRLAYIYYYHSCEEDEETRQFAEWPEGYRIDRLRRAIDGFEFGKWHCWRRRENANGFDSDDWRHRSGEPSDISHDLILAIIDIACRSYLDPHYIANDLYGVDIPTDSELIQNLSRGEYDAVLSHVSDEDVSLSNDVYEYTRKTSSLPKITPGLGHRRNREPTGEYRCVPPRVVKATFVKVDSRGEDTFEEAYTNLKQNGMVKVAEINPGEDYGMYPVSLPDHPEAEEIWFEGEEYTPEPEAEREAEPELVTDGGEARRDIEHIRRMRTGEESSRTQEVEILICPVDGCSRTIIDSPSALRSHVAQAGDDDHRFRMLNDQLEIEIDEEAYHSAWGPRTRDPKPDEPESIYESGDPWGPGVPNPLPCQ